MSERYVIRHDTSRHGLWTVYDTETEREIAWAYNSKDIQAELDRAKKAAR